MRPRQRAHAVILSVVIGAACSNGGSHASSSTTTSSGLPPSATTTTTGASVSTTLARSATTTTRPRSLAQDRAIARSALLTLKDLPKGSTGTPHVPTPNPALAARIARCLNVAIEFVNTDLQPHADSEDFTGPAGQQIQSGIALFATTSLTARAIAIYSTPKALTCLGALLAPGGVVLHGQPIPLGSVADGAVGLRFSLGLTADVLFARRGRALAYLVVITPAGVDETALLTKMTSRLTATA